MIPKVIHYCWFGHSPLPRLAKKCIKSWKKYLPDYEIREWNESNFDIDIVPYTREAYDAKKYAFVSDYARFWILYHYGGIYFDTDVEVIKSMNDVIARGSFMGCERNGSNTNIAQDALSFDIMVNPGLGLAASPGLSLYKAILDFYSNIQFINKDSTLNQSTVVEYVTGILKEYGLRNISEIQYVAGVHIYPKEYFSPFDFSTYHPIITPNTYAIHWFAGSWKEKKSWRYKIKIHIPLFLILLSQKIRIDIHKS